MVAWVAFFRRSLPTWGPTVSRLTTVRLVGRAAAEGFDDLVRQLLVGLQLLLGVGALDVLRRPDLELMALLPGLLDRAPAEADVRQGVRGPGRSRSGS